MSKMERVIYTIGHSTHSVDHFVRLLVHNGVTAVADVRSRPYSRMNPQFDRESLREVLAHEDIDYVFLGAELGARTEDRGCYVDGRVQYSRIAETKAFRLGLDRLVKGIEQYRVALMCAERDPLVCHRTILVCRHLVSRGVESEHILEDGRLEPRRDAEARLMSELGMQGAGLLRDPEELIDEAYERRGREIAYEVDESQSHEPKRVAR